MLLQRNRLTLSLVAVLVWVGLTAAPSLLPQEMGSLLSTVSSGIVLHILAAAAVLSAIAMALGWNDLGFVRPQPWRSLWLMWVPGLYVALFYVAGFAIGLPPLPTLAILFVNVVLVGISEELAFRGVLYRGLRTRLGMWPSVLISSAAFGAVHVLNVLATGDLRLAAAQALAAAMTGTVLMAIVIRTGSILPAIVLHIVWDFGGLIAAQGALQQVDAAATAGAVPGGLSPLIYLAPALFILPNFLYALFLLRRKRTAREQSPQTAAVPSVAAT